MPLNKPPSPSAWEQFIGITGIGEALSVADILLTLIGFTITVIAALRAKKAAELARLAAETAKLHVFRLDLVAEVAAVIQLLDELKRLHRAKALDLLPDRYTSVRAKVVSIKESDVVTLENDQRSLQDVVTRIAAIQKALDRNQLVLDDAKQLAKFNESISLCSDSMLAFKERLRNSMAVN